MNKSIVPYDKTLNCTRCGHDSECVRKCDMFYELMFSVIDIQSQHHEYESLLNMTQYCGDVELKTISAFLKEFSDQSCTFVSVFHNSVHEVIYI